MSFLQSLCIFLKLLCKQFINFSSILEIRFLQFLEAPRVKVIDIHLYFDTRRFELSHRRWLRWQ